jgi:hypothetical protein
MSSPAPSTSASAPGSGALADTRTWLEQAVIGLNLCPFAKAVHSKGQIRWVLSQATQPRELLGELVAELKTLATADPEVIDTTLLVCPGLLHDFLEFNDFLDVAEGALEDLGLEGQLQIASFHPHFRFDGTEPDDAGNLSNRSPHPTLHLLREDSVERAVAAFPEAEAIFERNIETLEAMTPAQRRAVFGDRG